MSASPREGESSEVEEADGTAIPPPNDAASETTYNAAFLRLQAELDPQPHLDTTGHNDLNSCAPLVLLLRAAATATITLIVQADRAWHTLSNAISGQTWGQADLEAKRAVQKLEREFSEPRSTTTTLKLWISCKCLISALEEEPKQNVMWYEADRGAPSFEEGCEMDPERLTVLMDAATDRLRIIKWDLRTMEAELRRNFEADKDNRAQARQSES